MIDIRNLIQTTLDTSLASKGIYSYWNKKIESQNENKDEYIVYTYGGEDTDDFADDDDLVKSLDVTIRYYYRDTLLESKAGRDKIKETEQLIKQALENAGFEIPYGSYDLGNIDSKKEGDMKGSGFNTVIFECEYWVVV